MNETRKVIGIDFGSSQSSIAIMDIGASSPPNLFSFQGSKRNDNGIPEQMPTVLLLDKNDDHVIAIGNQVDESEKNCPDNKYVSDFKRLLGTDNQEAKDASRYAEIFLAELMKQVKSTESSSLTPTKYATCIAYPAAWNESQVALLKSLVEQAGFPKDPRRGVYVLPEPVAALRSHLIHYDNKPETILVLDFGGGTLDVCIVETDIGGTDPIVLGIAGDAALGGRDFDLLLIDYFEKVFKDKHLDYKTLADQPRHDLDKAIREVKEHLSDNLKNNDEYCVSLIWPGVGKLKHSLSKVDFENLMKDKGIRERIRTCVKNGIADSGISPKEITRAILTGGSSLWYFVKEIVLKECNLEKTPDKVVISETPFTDVAIGCAMSKARTKETTEREGLWVRWRLDGQDEWQRPRNILRCGRSSEDSEIRIQSLGKIEHSRFWKPFRIEFSFWEGDEEWHQQPYRDGKHAVVDFHARSNHPLLKRPRDIFNAAMGRLDRIDRDFKDVYECFLLCREFHSGGAVFKLEIRDRKASTSELPEVSWDSPDLIDIEPGKLSRKGWFGFFGEKTRKSVVWDEPSQKRP